MSLLIVHNLLENARKYNRPDGRVLVRALRDEVGTVRLLLGNTSPGIDPAAHGYIFERFHRGAANENGPGHGLGLNRARAGLVRSENDWTKFEASFRAYLPDLFPAEPRS